MENRRRSRPGSPSSLSLSQAGHVSANSLMPSSSSSPRTHANHVLQSKRMARLSVLPILLLSFSALLCSVTIPTAIPAVDASSPSTSTIIRVRLTDGSMTRVAIPKGSEDDTTLSDILSRADVSSNKDSNKNIDVQVGQGASQSTMGDADKGKTLSELGLRHGTLLTLLSKSSNKKSQGMTKKVVEAPTISSKSSSNRFDPFPSLSKPAAHSAALRRARALAQSSRGQSYEQISKLREYMHTVEPQPEGSVKRIYMCTQSADRFKVGCTIKPTKKQIIAAKKAGTVDKLKDKIVNRVGLCLGTMGRERVDQKKDKVRTSLSTPLYEREMCDVAKVQAIWEPKGQRGSGERYDAKAICAFEEDGEVKRVLRVADALGLRPVGWIYSYADDRHTDGGEDGSDEDSLPVYAADVYHGAVLQIGNMRSRLGREEGKKFVTLALDAKSGATEAFQLSGVSVQMVAEGLIPPPPKPVNVDDGGKNKKKGGGRKKGKDNKSDKTGRYVTTAEKFLIDSEETKELDSVLCLINTALLGHTGTFCGTQAESAVNKKGQLTAKTKKRILKALETSNKSSKGDVELFEALCDFNVLLAMDGLLNKGDMDELCRLVKKWARGQRRGTEMGKTLKMALKMALEV